MFPRKAAPADPLALLEVYPRSGRREFTGGLLIWRLEPGKLGVEGAFDGETAAIEDVGVDHGGADILVTQ